MSELTRTFAGGRQLGIAGAFNVPGTCLEGEEVLSDLAGSAIAFTTASAEGVLAPARAGSEGAIAMSMSSASVQSPMRKVFIFTLHLLVHRGLRGGWLP